MCHAGECRTASSVAALPAWPSGGSGSDGEAGCREAGALLQSVAMETERDRGCC